MIFNINMIFKKIEKREHVKLEKNNLTCFLESNKEDRTKIIERFLLFDFSEKKL